jgi:hypothetical protein
MWHVCAADDFGGELELNLCLEDVGIDRRVILSCMLKELDGGGMEWINLT